MSEAHKSGRLVGKKLDANGRVFNVELLKFSNGIFATISEDPEPRLGTITLSLKTHERVSSSNLIPDRRGSIFSGMVGELIVEKTQGISIVSLYLREEIDATITKMLLSTISELLDSMYSASNLGEGSLTN